jgi:hypothetical protein
MKKALIGLSDNVTRHIDKIQLWSKSFKKYCNHDIILLVANGNDQDLKACENLDIIPIPVDIDDPKRINHKRLNKISTFLSKSDIDLCIVTDVFDVVFQADPFIKLDTDNYNVFVSGEGVNVNKEPWNSHNISLLFPSEFNKCSDKEIICSGIIAGKKNDMINLYINMFDLCENSTNLHDIQDQAALMVLAYSNKIDRLKIFTLDDGWAIHCAVAGPTQFFDSWGFRNNLKYSIPKIHNGVVYSGNGLLFDMTHQFNRVPEWHQSIKSNYGL